MPLFPLFSHLLAILWDVVVLRRCMSTQSMPLYSRLSHHLADFIGCVHLGEVHVDYPRNSCLKASLMIHTSNHTIWLSTFLLFSWIYHLPIQQKAINSDVNRHYLCVCPNWVNDCVGNFSYWVGIMPLFEPFFQLAI